MNTQENDRHEKKDVKKYSIHQKINTRMLGLEIFNQNIAVPYNAYLICKLIYKEDVQSLKEIEEIIYEIQDAWENEQQDIFIKKINVFTSEKYFLLTFSLGFFQKEQVKKLQGLKEWVKNKIENHTRVVLQKKLMESNLLKKISIQIEQLEIKVDKIESRTKKNEEVVTDSSKKLEAVAQMNQMFATKVTKEIESLKIENKNIVKTNQKKSNIEPHTNVHKNEKKRNKFYLVRGKKEEKVLKRWKTSSPSLRSMQVNNTDVDNIQPKTHLSEYKKKIAYYFTEVEMTEKKQMIPKKKFLEWQAKIEYIDYLWKMLESERQSELVIDEKLSCKNLIDELPVTLAAVEELSKSTKIFNYWIYCPQIIMVKLKGYVVLAEYLASITDNTETVFMVS